MKPLFHYTCDHGWTALAADGLVLPAAQLTDRRLPWPATFAWFTDLSTPVKEPLGLTNHYAPCDRTAHRYRVTDHSHVQPWPAIARTMPRDQRDTLELAPGARPRHWFVTTTGVPVTYDPIRAAA